MEKQEYKIVWYKTEEERPAVGNFCPKCKDGKVQLSRFVATDYYCNNKECGWKWKKSRFSGGNEPQLTPTGGKTTSQVIMERLDRLEAGLKVPINEILNKISNWEKEDKIVIYPKGDDTKTL